MRITTHICISVDGVLAMSPSQFEREFDNVVRDHTGKMMTTAEVRRHFEEARDKGYKVLPMNGECEGFSYETGCPGHVIKPKIYTASKVKHADTWKALRSGGYEIVSTWIDEAGAGETTDRADLAKRCIQECKDADCVLIYTEPGEYLKGAFIEIGAALAADREIYAVGPVLPDTSVFRGHPRWHQHESLVAALAAIGERF